MDDWLGILFKLWTHQASSFAFFDETARAATRILRQLSMGELIAGCNEDRSEDSGACKEAPMANPIPNCTVLTAPCARTVQSTVTIKSWIKPSMAAIFQNFHKQFKNREDESIGSIAGRVRFTSITAQTLVNRSSKHCSSNMMVGTGRCWEPF